MYYNDSVDECGRTTTSNILKLPIHGVALLYLDYPYCYKVFLIPIIAKVAKWYNLCNQKKDTRDWYLDRKSVV